MGFDPASDMCNPNRQRTWGEKVVYHAKWAFVSTVVVLASPWFMARWVFGG